MPSIAQRTMSAEAVQAAGYTTPVSGVAPAFVAGGDSQISGQANYAPSRGMIPIQFMTDVDVRVLHPSSATFQRSYTNPTP